jgi:outer membrane protein assembly factor BamB
MARPGSISSFPQVPGQRKATGLAGRLCIFAKPRDINVAENQGVWGLYHGQISIGQSRQSRPAIPNAAWLGLIGALAFCLGCQSDDSRDIYAEQPAKTALSVDASSNPPGLSSEGKTYSGIRKQIPSSADALSSAPVLYPEGKTAVPGRQAGWPLWRGDRAGTGQAASWLPEKLHRQWTFQAPGGGFEATAVIADGCVYIGTTDGPFYAIDLRTGRQRWAFTEGAGYLAPAAAADGLVFVGDVQGRFFALRQADGQPAWRFEAEAEIDGGPNVYEDRVLFGSQDGCLYCLQRDTGRLVWKYQSPDQIRCFPTVWDGLALVAGCDGRLHLVDLQKGQPAGEVELKGPTGCTPAVLEERAFVGTESRQFFAIHLRERKILWTFESPKSKQSFRSSAAVTPEAVYVGCRDRRVYALDIKTGQVLWQFATRGQVDSSPVVVGDRLFVGSEDGRLYGLDRRTGQVVWQFELGGQVPASPAVADGHLVIGNTAGQLYCFGPPDRTDASNRSAASDRQ